MMQPAFFTVFLLSSLDLYLFAESLLAEKCCICFLLTLRHLDGHTLSEALESTLFDIFRLQLLVFDRDGLKLLAALENVLSEFCHLGR